ncbi:hypothetical protein APED_00780 [Acanthopleuribacter pedis]
MVGDRREAAGCQPWVRSHFEMVLWRSTTTASFQTRIDQQRNLKELGQFLGYLVIGFEAHRVA